MKCPKCSYTSFDYNENCPKCGVDLADLRTLLQIIAVSPESRAPSLNARAPEPPPAVADPAGEDTWSDQEARESIPAREDERASLQTLDFDESFADMIEPTSLTKAKSGTAPSAAGEPKPEKSDELLDLDFGDLFGEEGSKTQ